MWYSFDGPRFRVAPQGVATTFALEIAAVLAQVLELVLVFT
jgi:hypothetical protein